MRKLLCIAAAGLAAAAGAAEFFVAKDGNDANDGSARAPWLTIQRAADVARAGDVVTIHGGVYREWVKPANAGRAGAPIVYQAAKGESVVVTGADPVTGWTRGPEGLWMVKLRYDTFGGLNPFTDVISGDWFDARGQTHFRTRLIQDGKPLELHTRQAILAGGNILEFKVIEEGHAVLVPGEVSGTIIANFAKDPNVSTPELIVRPACFYPVEEYRDYIALRGISFKNAGPNWAPPTSEQVAIVGTNWSRGWTIEDCEISGTECSGITLGKYGDVFDDLGGNAQEQSNAIARSTENGLDRVGHHVIRRCRITDCGQAGICGHLGGAFSTIDDCEISYCHLKKAFTGAEMAGIKIHAAIDFTISNCRIHHCGAHAGIWFDWMAQGARISGNRLWANSADLFFEVDHGPVLVEGNDLMSDLGVWAYAKNVAFTGNRIKGAYRYSNDRRRTPVFKPHTAVIDSLDSLECSQGAFIYINNILACDPRYPKEKHPSRYEDNWFVPAEYWHIDEASGACTLTPPPDLERPAFKPVDAARIGKAIFLDQEYPAVTRQFPRI